jgi:hypothetical protein
VFIQIREVIILLHNAALVDLHQQEFLDKQHHQVHVAQMLIRQFKLQQLQQHQLALAASLTMLDSVTVTDSLSNIIMIHVLVLHALLSTAALAKF